MREKLNSNPMAQLAVIGVLLLAAGFFVMSSMGGGGEEEAETTTTTSSATLETPEGSASITATVTTPVGVEPSPTPTTVPPLPPGAVAPRLPQAVTEAFAANRTVVLLFVHEGGIDDRKVAAAVAGLRSLPDVAAFVVPADHIARYAAISQGVAVDRVPALVVVRPKGLSQGIPVASVHYGFQSPQSVVQAVIDAGYRGRTIEYHP